MANTGNNFNLLGSNYIYFRLFLWTLKENIYKKILNSPFEQNKQIEKKRKFTYYRVEYFLGKVGDDNSVGDWITEDCLRELLVARHLGHIHPPGHVSIHIII